MVVLKRAIGESIHLGDGQGGLLTIKNHGVTRSNGHLSLRLAVGSSHYYVELPRGESAGIAQKVGFKADVEVTNVRPGTKAGHSRIGLIIPAGVTILDDSGRVVDGSGQ